MKRFQSIELELSPLLTERETIPAVVKKCAESLRDLEVWHKFSRNATAMSCADAARKRTRLGHVGIPLWDELKTFLGEVEDADGKKQLFLAHCRGDKELDLEKLKGTLHAIRLPKRLNQDQASDTSAQYGAINPFTTVGEEVIQIFDYELHRSLGVPGTVMTNAGDHSWAVEFDPAELVMKLPRARWADISEPRVESQRESAWGVRDPLPIGILTGNPSDSGLDLWHSLNHHVRSMLGSSSLGDVSMPKVIMSSSPNIGISMEMDIREEPLLKALLRGVDELCAAGAKLLAHPAHTTHYFLPHLNARAAQTGAKFLSMAEVTATKLRQSGIREITLLGTRYVTDFRLPWSVYREAFSSMKVHVPSEEGWQKIHQLGYEVQQHGPTPMCFNWMRDLLRREVPASCKHVVLAMTEFSPVAKHLKARGKQGKVLLDPVDLYAEALARAYLGLADTEKPVGT